MTGSAFPAFIRAEYDPSGTGFQQYERAAADSVTRTQRRFEASAEEITRVISSTLTRGLSSAGAVDLGVAEMRQAAAEARAYGESLAVTLTTARALARSTGDTSEQTKLYLQALEAQHNEARRAISTNEAQVTTYTRLQAAMSQTASRTSALAQSYRALFAEQALAAKAEVTGRRYQEGYSEVFSPGVSRQTKSASDSAEIFAAAAAMDDLRLAEAGAAQGADLLASAHRQTALALDHTVKSARDSFSVFQAAADADERLARAADLAWTELERQTEAMGRATVAAREAQQAQLAAASAFAQPSAATQFDQQVASYQELAAAALSVNRTASGSLDLGVERHRAAAEAAEAQAIALRELAAQMVRTASAEGDLSEAARIEIQAAQAAARGAEDHAAAERSRASAIEQLQNGINGVASQTKLVVGAQNGMAQAIGRGTDGLRAQRFAMIGIGQQLTDIGVGFVSGQRAATIFAQQLPQLGFALTGFEGETNKTLRTLGKFGVFMSGPWGAALTLGGFALGALGAKLLDFGDDAEDAKEKVDDLAAAIKELNGIKLTPATVVLDAATKAELKIRELEAAIDRTPGTRAGAQTRSRLNKELSAEQQNLTNLRDQLELRDKLDIQEKRIEAGKTKRAGTDREAAKAARDAAKAQREFEQSLSDIIKRFDPARAAAESYAATLREISDLEAAGKLNLGESILYSTRASIAELKRLKEQPDPFYEAIGIDADAELRKAVDGIEARMESGMEQAAETFRVEGSAAAQAIAQILNGGLGGTVGKMAGLVNGLATGNFSGLGGALGGALTLLGGGSGGGANDNDPISGLSAKIRQSMREEGLGTFQDGLSDMFDPLTDEMKRVTKSMLGIFGEGGNLDQKLGQIAGGALLGFGVGGLVGGGAGGKLGGALGGALGQEVGKSLTKGLTGILGDLGGPLGSIAGGLVGGLVGGLFSKTKKGSATIGFNEFGGLGVTGTGGNTQSYIRGATNNANSVIGTLEAIADQLGGDLSGSLGVSVGRRKKKFVVDTTGSGRTKGAGVEKFADEAEAIKYAIQDAINDGVIQGLRAGTRSLIQGAGDLERQLTKAVKFESVFKDLKRATDPVGAAIDDINDRFADLGRIFKEANATTEDYTKLEQLYALQRKEAVESAASSMTATLKSLMEDLTTNNDALSLRDRLGSALTTYNPLAQRVAAGDQTVDYDAFAEAARNLLDIQRQMSGSQDDYFARLNEVTSLTAQALKGQENVVSIANANTTPFDVRTDSSPQVVNGDAQVVGSIDNLYGMTLQQLSSLNGQTAKLIDLFSGSLGGDPTNPFQARYGRLGF